MMTTSDIRFAFFGTSRIAVYVLDELERAGSLPALVVTVPQKPRGRGLASQPTDVEGWATARGIPVAHDWEAFERDTWDAAVVVDYGKILPQHLLAHPRRGFLNVHPSLLPRLRGASPIRSAILHDEKSVGVTVMLVDAEMDHGPIVAQKKVEVDPWPPTNSALERALMETGGKLLVQILPLWVSGEIDAHEQNHDLATYTQKFTKEDGLLNLADDAYTNMLKIRAFEEWPGTYAFFKRGEKEFRVQILEAHIDSEKLVIDTVKPEGKKEMAYADFVRSGVQPL